MVLPKIWFSPTWTDGSVGFRMGYQSPRLLFLYTSYAEQVKLRSSWSLEKKMFQQLIEFTQKALQHRPGSRRTRLALHQKHLHTMISDLNNSSYPCKSDELCCHSETNPSSETNYRHTICHLKQHFVAAAEVEQLWMKVSTCLSNAKVSPSNISIKERKTCCTSHREGGGSFMKLGRLGWAPGQEGTLAWDTEDIFMRRRGLIVGLSLFHCAVIALQPFSNSLWLINGCDTLHINNHDTELVVFMKVYCS